MRKATNMLGLAALTVCLQANSLSAAPPGMLKHLFQSKSSQTETLQGKHGPWLIHAQSFNGDGARDKAIAYAKELSQALKAPTFIMERADSTPDSLGSSQRVVTDKNGKAVQKQVSARYANDTDDKSIGVLIGEYHSKEDPQIEKMLDSVRNFQTSKKSGNLRNRAHVFLTRNPLLPDDYFQAPDVDDFTEKLNRDPAIKYSLLDCPSKFTVRVASFRAPEVVTVAATSKILGKGEDEHSDILVKAASKAHKLTTALRKKGVEAYEYHDRAGSYVMIGSFDRLGTEKPDGSFEYHPGIVETLSKYCGYHQVVAKDRRTGAESTSMTVKAEANIPFDVEGKPIAVPRKQTRVYGGSTIK
jgi:hypothetical protein